MAIVRVLSRQALVAGFSWLLLPIPSQATAVAVLATRDRIVIAADASAAVASSGVQQLVIKRECKIRVVNGFVYAVSGLVKENQTGFNANAVISEILLQCRDCSIDQAGERILRALSSQVSEALSSIASSMPDQFEQLRQLGSGPGLKFVLATYGGDVAPQAYLAEIRSDGSIGHLPLLDLDDDDIAVTMLGSDIVALPYLKKNSPATRQDAGDLEVFARQLVQMEIDHSQATDSVPVVGPPINVAVLEAGVLDWGNPSPTCPLP